MGPILRSRLFAALNKPRDVAQAYTEALERSPRQLDVRMLLGETKLKLGEADEALRQAKLVLDVEKNRPDAVLLEARALAEAGTTTSQKKAQRKAAVARLEAAIKADPHFDEAYHALAEILLSDSDRAAAIAVWRDDLKANPGDATAVGPIDRNLHAFAGPAASRPPRPTLPRPSDWPPKSPVATTRAT